MKQTNIYIFLHNLIWSHSSKHTQARLSVTFSSTAENSNKIYLIHTKTAFCDKITTYLVKVWFYCFLNNILNFITLFKISWVEIFWCGSSDPYIEYIQIGELATSASAFPPRLTGIGHFLMAVLEHNVCQLSRLKFHHQ